MPQLDHDIDGLVHISQISEERIDKVKDVLEAEQKINARVIKIDRDERRIGLSIKAAEYDEDQLERERIAFDALNSSDDLTNLGDILDNVTTK